MDFLTLVLSLKQKMLSIKRIVENITQIGIVILLGSFVRLYIYYYWFNIDIVSSIDLSEVPKYSIDVFLVLFFLLSSNVLMFFKVSITERMTIIGSIVRSIPKKEVSEKTTANRINQLILWLLIMFSSMLIWGLKIYQHVISTYTYFIMGLTLFCIILIISYIFFIIKPADIKNAGNRKINLKSVLIVSLIAVYLTFNALIGAFQIITLKKDNEQVSFCYQEQTINSNDKFYVIGETSKYLFMYDEKLNKSFIFSKSDLKYFSIQRVKAKRST